MNIHSWGASLLTLLAFQLQPTTEQTPPTLRSGAVRYSGKDGDPAVAHHGAHRAAPLLKHSGPGRSDVSRDLGMEGVIRYDSVNTQRGVAAAMSAAPPAATPGARSDKPSRVKINGATYYVRDDVYYILRRTTSGESYIAVDPPAGAAFKHLPGPSETVEIEGATYYYCNDRYYAADLRPEGTVYVAFDPPEGAAVRRLPDRRKTEVIEGKTYYIVSAMYFRPCYRSGRIAYLRVSKP